MESIIVPFLQEAPFQPLLNKVPFLSSGVVLLLCILLAFWGAPYGRCVCIIFMAHTVMACSSLSQALWRGSLATTVLQTRSLLFAEEPQVAFM